jgi:cell division topological specificity factor
VLREEILAVIARHVQVDGEKVHVTMERDKHVSILEIEVEIPLEGSRLAA